MKWTHAAGLLTALALAAPTPADETPAGKAAKKPTEVKLVGSYKITGGMRDGEKLPGERFAGSVVVFTDDTVVGTDKSKKNLFKSTYKLDTSAKPVKIMMKSEADGKTLETAGVVSLEGDTVKICYALPGGETPTDFEAKQRQLCFVMKRMKE